jgi:DNA-binding response OmpR family regulator
MLYLEKSPNIVFIDIGLPDGSGNDLAQRIKAHNPSVYIVMATASHKTDDKVAAVRNHVDGYIGKPLRKKELGDLVERYKSHAQRTSH